MTDPTPSFAAAELRHPPVAWAVQHCRAVTRHHSKTFYLGSQLFAPAERAAVWAVYAACRSGDDIVDEGQEGGPDGSPDGAEALERWWLGIQAVFAGSVTPSPLASGQGGADPIWPALSWAVRHYPIPQSAFAELHQGLQMDLCGHDYRDMDDLLLYCRRVAGVVGFMIAPICGYRGGDQTLAYALQLGQAMQLTNILRDVGEDLSRGRVYLPQSLLSGYGLCRADLERYRAGEALSGEYRALMRHLSMLAREWYAAGRAGIPLLRGRGPLAVLTAANAYEGILDDLERGGFDNFNRRAYVPGRQKFLLLARACWQVKRPSGPIF